ncbi:MAG: DUF4398 domain-containing protein, partial [Gammaproteobacteria bacterium]|nr:DUF4398 domain-containing protein [Gammaproteobacteria bacterium]
MTRLLIAALLALSLAACASAPKSIPALEQARADVQAAQADADAQRYANREIEEAARLLASAENAAKERKDLPTIGHLAYLSSQTAKIAREAGKTKAAEQRIAQGSSERERIRLEARTREAQAARSAAQQAQMEAQRARSAATQAGTQLAVAQERSAQLEKEMEELMAKRSERGLVVTLGDVLFDTG